MNRTKKEALLMNIIQKLVSKVTGQKSGRIQLKWEFNTNSSIFCDPCIDDINLDGKQEIIIGTKEGILYVLNNEGKIIWYYKITENISKERQLFKETSTLNSIYGTPYVCDIDDDGKKVIIFGTELGIVYCLSNDGKILWSFKTEGPIRTSPIVEELEGEKKIIFGSMDNFLYILDKSGKLVNRFHAQDGIESSPSILRTKGRLQIIFGCNDGYVYSIDEKINLIWQFKTNKRIVTKPIIRKLHNDDKQSILVTSTDNFLYILNDQGTIEQKFETNAQIISDPTVQDIDGDKEAEIFIGSCDDNIYSLSPIIQKIWRYETDFWIGSHIIVEDIDNDDEYEVVVGSYDKSLYILDSKPDFVIEYMPGISGIAKQNSDYGAMTKQAQHLRGRKLWQYNTGGIITGMEILDLKTEKNIIVNTKNGIVKCFVHVNE